MTVEQPAPVGADVLTYRIPSLCTYCRGVGLNMADCQDGCDCCECEAAFTRLRATEYDAQNEPVDFDGN